MLFGASIEPRPNGNYRLRIKRARSKWPTLGFLLIVAESQDPEFSFLTFRMTSTNGSLLLLTRDSRFLGASHRRWYKAGELATPADVAMDESAKAFWLIGHWKEVDMKMPAGIGMSWAQAEVWLKQRVPEKVWRQTG